MNHGKKYKWHKIAGHISEIAFGENHLAEIAVAGKIICLAKTRDSIAACNAVCPHAGGRMAAGILDKNENIVCPIHRYVFNLKNGRDITGEGYFLKTFPVKIEGEGVFVGFEEGGLFSWLK